LVHLIEHGDIVLIHVLRPTNRIVGVYKVGSVLKGTRGIWDEKVYPFGIELEPAEDFKGGIEPIPLSSLIGAPNEDTEISPFLKGVPIFQVSNTVLEKLKSNQSNP